MGLTLKTLVRVLNIWRRHIKSVYLQYKKTFLMKDNALSVANYFIDLAHSDGKDMRPLKLMKLVYIAYGYALALLGRSIIDYRFDKVEAWKFGPVIPSVYHSFKNYGKSPITDKTTVLIETKYGFETEEPELNDNGARRICEFVWKKYGLAYSDNELVTLMHGKGTPWGQVYTEGENNAIPEIYTKLYYTELVRRISDATE